MLRIIPALLVIVYYYGAFMCLACLLPEKYHGCRPVSMCLLGFMLYFSAFHLMALPMKLWHLPLHALSLSWFVFLAAVLLFVLIRRKSTWRKAAAALFCRPDRYTLCFIVFTLALTALLAVNVNHISDYDAGYYIGLPVSSKFSDTIELMNPFSGKLKDDVKSFYQLNTDTVHAAVIYQVLRLHPLIHAKITFTAVLCMLFCMTVYRIGAYLFSRRWIPLFGITALMVLLFSYSLAGVSHYFAYRPYEGKAVCAYLYTTVILVCILAVRKKKDAGWGWATLFFTSLSGVCFCNTALFIVPLMILMYMIPTVCLTRGCLRSRIPLRLICVLVPAGIWLVLYSVL